VGEFAIIDLIRNRCAIVREDVRLGIGDDGAILSVPSNHELVVSTDTLVDGVHFPSCTAAADIGWKSLAVNLSDLAAMGATPAWATLALTLPDSDHRWIEGFCDGFTALAGEFKLALVGGDTTRGPLTITVTIHGFVPTGAALLRSGAHIGDLVYVTGTLGDAAAGLRRIANVSPQDALVRRLNRPTPRVAQGLELRGRARACIDVSDGLLADLGHICTASGVGAEIDADSLPASSELLMACSAEERRAFQLGSGDDYELCFTASEAEASVLLSDLARTGCGATRIGRVVAGLGVRVVDANGADIDVSVSGWDHFRS
jgi:thiamine-monophosphate kinase